MRNIKIYLTENLDNLYSIKVDDAVVKEYIDHADVRDWLRDNADIGDTIIWEYWDYE